MPRKSSPITSRVRRSHSPPPDDLRQTAAYSYALPDELIAHEPAPARDASRLLVLRAEGVEHREFVDFPSLVREGDVLVLNETRVVRARLRGRRPSGGSAEILLLRPAAGRFDFHERRWIALVRPGRRLRAGDEVELPQGARIRIVETLDDGPRVIDIETPLPLDAYLERHGEVPLPPYVGPGDPARDERYQTVFARVPGSVAAPTASLHFTPEILAAVRARGVTIVPLVLDVGIGTFRPIASATIDAHSMHAERYAIPAATAETIGEARRRGGRVVAAGTTVVRALEGAWKEHGALRAGEGETRLYITPGFRFGIVDALLTNFHLPRSTLLALVCAFAGYEPTMHAYRAAIAERYRFFSFGDAMWCERSAL